MRQLAIRITGITVPLVLTLLLAVVSCTGSRQQAANEGPPWQEIAGRDETSEGSTRIRRYPVYRVRVPEGWKRQDPADDDSIADTTLSIVEFVIEDSDGSIVVTVHNFPVELLAERIPPRAQVVRWQGQFDPLDPNTTSIVLQAHGGYAGLLLEGSGELKGNNLALLAWAMQLAPEHFRHLILVGSPEEMAYFRQMRADYTIKATGSPEAISRHRNEIASFSRSFELIQEIPVF